jgi:hypothetical protein
LARAGRVGKRGAPSGARKTAQGERRMKNASRETSARIADGLAELSRRVHELETGGCTQRRRFCGRQRPVPPDGGSVPGAAADASQWRGRERGKGGRGGADQTQAECGTRERSKTGQQLVKRGPSAGQIIGISWSNAGQMGRATRGS